MSPTRPASEGGEASQGLALPTLPQRRARSSLPGHGSPIWMSGGGSDIAQQLAGGAGRPAAREVSSQAGAGTSMGRLTS